MAEPLSETPSARAARYRRDVPGLVAASAGEASWPDLVRVSGPQAGARAAALEIVAALSPRGGRLAVPGGRTAAAVFEALAGPAPGARIDWPRVEVSFVDERAVPAGDPESNYALARRWLVDALGAPESSLRRLRADAPDLEAAARGYERVLERPLDLVLLGIGEDGHFASLFPGSPLLAERARRVAVVRDSPKPPPVRLTITPRVLAEARRVLVLAMGRAKTALLERVFAASAPGPWLPAGALRDAVWIADAEEAAPRA